MFASTCKQSSLSIIPQCTPPWVGYEELKWCSVIVWTSNGICWSQMHTAKFFFPYGSLFHLDLWSEEEHPIIVQHCLNPAKWLSIALKNHRDRCIPKKKQLYQYISFWMLNVTIASNSSANTSCWYSWNMSSVENKLPLPTNFLVFQTRNWAVL